MQKQPHSDAVLSMLSTGEWSLTKHIPHPDMTDEFNTERAWSVSRTQAPFCDKQSIRVWCGESAYAAFSNAHKALGMSLPATGSKSLVEAQFGVYFSVGPTGEENQSTNSQRQARSYNAMQAILIDRGIAELGVATGEFGNEFKYLPISLCECDWDYQTVDGQDVYSIWFHSDNAFDETQTTKLRAMAQEAYTKLCGADARFVRAEMYQKWSTSDRVPYVFKD